MNLLVSEPTRRPGQPLCQDPWYCANQFDAVNNPPLPPGANGGGGAVAGPCDSGQQGVITYTPDGRKQQCSYGHWVYIA
jgi:hypothetical protein